MSPTLTLSQLGRGDWMPGADCWFPLKSEQVPFLRGLARLRHAGCSRNISRFPPFNTSLSPMEKRLPASVSKFCEV